MAVAHRRGRALDGDMMFGQSSRSGTGLSISSVCGVSRTRQEVSRLHCVDIPGGEHPAPGDAGRRPRVFADAGDQPNYLKHPEHPKLVGNARARDWPGALKYGANDLGSIMIEENVFSRGGHDFSNGRRGYEGADEGIGRGTAARQLVSAGDGQAAAA
ncbi:MAG: hypothetical protein CM1200mP29_03760 [Verrucomicrobiota bacterium]|nr:MAG: hypothetical protein CM1200mP29_03760 [Verrucomicrobiota bacterium]